MAIASLDRRRPGGHSVARGRSTTIPRRRHRTASRSRATNRSCCQRHSAGTRLAAVRDPPFWRRRPVRAHCCASTATSAKKPTRSSTTRTAKTKGLLARSRPGSADCRWRGRRVVRPRRARGRHDATARGRRRAEGRQRPPRHGHVAGPAGLPALPERHDARPARPVVARPRPVRAVLRALEPDAVHPALPQRLRPLARRPQVAAHVGLADARPPRGPPHPGRRDHDRPARLRPRVRRRHGDGAAPPARPLRPGREAGHEPLRPPRLRHRLRRRHAGGRLPRGLRARRPPGARQPHRRLRRQPDLDRGRHRHRVQRGRRRPLQAYGWHVVEVDWRKDADGATYVEDVDALLAAIRSGDKVTDKPTLVVLHTIIAWPAPTKQNTGKSHGSALGDEEVGATKELLGFDPKKTFAVEPAVLKHARDVVKRGKAAHREWDKGIQGVAQGQPRPRGPARPHPRRQGPRRSRQGAADLPGRREGRRDARRLRQGAHRPRRRHARAVGRLGRPRRVQQHDDGGPALLHPRAASRPASGRAARSAAPCTSASARTGWA